MPKLIPFHTVVVLHSPHYIKWYDWSGVGEGGGRCQNTKKQYIIKSY